MVFGIAGARDANLGRVEDCFRAKTEGARNHRPQRKATEAAAAAEATRTTKALSTTKPIGGVSKQHPFLSRCTCDAPRPSTLRPEARVRSKLLYGRSSIAVAVSRVRFKGFFRLLICAVRTNSGAGGGVRQRACNDPCPAACLGGCQPIQSTRIIDTSPRSTSQFKLSTTPSPSLFRA